jgi:hypothetical protein
MSSGTRVETISVIAFTVYNNAYTIRINVYGKETTKCESTIELHPLPKDDPQKRCPDITKLAKLVGGSQMRALRKG